MRALTLAALVLFALLVSAPANGAAQDAGWTEIYNRPPNTVGDINMLDESFGLALTAPGMLVTTDGGRTWTEPAARPLIPRGATGIADREHAWSVGYDGAIWRTDDGALTWRRQTSGTKVHLADIAVVSANEAWVTGVGEGWNDIIGGAEPSTLLHTTDGGETWVTVPMEGFGQFVSVEAGDGRVWLAVTPCRVGDPRLRSASDAGPACKDRKSLLVSDDGGTSWRTEATEPEVTPTWMHFFSRDEGIAFSTSCSVAYCPPSYFATADGGRTWTPRGAVPGPPFGGLHRVSFADREVGWTANLKCEEGRCSMTIYRTLDGARTWQIETVTPPQGLGPGAAFFATGRDTILAVGGESGIAEYDAASGRWTQADTPAGDSLHGLQFIDDATGFAIAGGDVIQSHDGGTTWEPLATPADTNLFHVSSDGTWWTTGPCAVPNCTERPLFRSRDRGKTWDERTIPESLFFQTADAERAWLSTLDGLLRTDDGGLTWRTLTLAPYGRTVLFPDHDHGWVPCEGDEACRGTIGVTVDGGDTWQARALPMGASNVRFYSPSFGRATIPANQVAVTSDGGTTWDVVTGDRHVEAAQFMDDLHGWGVAGVSGSKYGVVSTADGGRTWVDEFPMPGGNFSDAVIFSEHYVWVVVNESDTAFPGNRHAVYRHPLGDAPDQVPVATTAAQAVAGSHGEAMAFALAGLGVAAVLLALAATASRVMRRRSSA